MVIPLTLVLALTQQDFFNRATGLPATPATPPNPTSDLTPAPTGSGIILRFPIVKLHGIGTAGDNTNPNLLGNPNPLTTAVVLTVEIYDQSGSLISSSTGNLDYQAADGYYSGNVSLGSQVTAGSYLIKVKVPKYLRRQLSGIINLNQGALNQMPAVSLITGDIKADNMLTIQDYNVLIGCYSDLLPAKDCDEAKKSSADISDDGKVNQDDYNLFLRELSVVFGE